MFCSFQAINLFTNVWGAGAATARQWVAMGFRTLDDLREKANLTRHQVQLKGESSAWPQLMAIDSFGCTALVLRAVCLTIRICVVPDVFSPKAGFPLCCLVLYCRCCYHGHRTLPLPRSNPKRIITPVYNRTLITSRHRR